jgi:type IV secretory pathway ATPase VirB11/archaellum biosynthesis ATPase
MLEYGEGVGQAGKVAGSGHAANSGSTDIGTSIGASLTDALNHTSAVLGVPPALLLVVAIIAVLFVAYLVFVR